MAELPVHTITAELATLENTARFGQLLSRSGAALPHVYGDSLETYKVGRLEAAGPVEEIEYIWTLNHHNRGQRVLYLERHLNITQSFIPLGAPIIAILAAPDARLENGMPALDEIRAFIVPATAGFNMHRGCWHEVPTAIYPETVVLLTSHAAVTSGWAEIDTPGQINAGDVEKREVSMHLGVDLRWEIPAAIYATLGLAR